MSHRSYRRFSPSEDRILRAGLLVKPEMSVSEIAREFHRLREAVYRRAVKLGLKGPDQVWSR
jgi:hypothetical protein